MSVPLIQEAFNAGEISPELYGEVDLAKYSSAATTLRNLFVNYRGGACSRGGLAAVGRALQSAGGNGAIVFSANPADTQTIVLNGQVWTFVAGAAGANQTHIGANLAATLVQLQADLTASVNGAITPALYTVTATMLIIRIKATSSLAGVAYALGGGTSGAVPSGATLSTAPARPISFQFNITQGYTLEFGDYYLRFVFQGGYVLESGVAVTGATNANPCQISVAGTPFKNGDWVFGFGIGGMTQLNGNTYIVANAAAGHFTLQDLNGNPVDSTLYGAFTAGGTFARIYTVATPYAAIDLPYLKFAESADVMTLTLSNPVTGNEYTPYNLTRIGNTNWTLNPITFAAAIAAPTGLAAVAQSSDVPSTYYSYVVTAVNAVTGEESVASTTVSVQNNNIAVSQGTNTITWNAVPGAGYYNVYKSTPSFGQPVPVGEIYGLMKGGVLGTAAVDTNVVPDFTQSPPLHANPFARGQILDIVPTAPGINYSPSTIIGTLGSVGAGTGFIGTPIANNGGFGGYYIANPGHDFPPGVTIAITDSGGGVATGGYAVAANPSDGDVMSINGTPITWRRQGPTPAYLEVTLGSTFALSIQNLANYLNASTNINFINAVYTYDATDLFITYKKPGAIGNTYTLGAGPAGWTRTAATLAGGGTVGSGATGTVTVGPQSGTYPGVCAFFQQREFFADSFNNPDTFWTSKTGAYNNLDTGIPVTATDAITASPWTEQVNGIQWLVPMPGGLIAMTGNRAWQILGEGSYALNPQPITPSTTQAQPQAFNGCSATVPPIVVDFDVIYREAINNVVRDLAWNFWTNIYTGNDLTILSSHLFLNTNIVNWAWARAPYKVLWGFRDDGTMLSLTYLKEQEVYGWARHDTLGLVVGMTSVSEPPANAVYAIVQRFPPYAPQGIYVMERMDNRLWQSVEDAYAVDSGVSNPMTTPATFLYASAASGAGVTFTAGANVFSAGSVGQVIRMGGGIATVTGYTSATKVTGTWNLGASNGAIGLPFASSGNWTIATPVNTIQAPHLAQSAGLVGLLDGVPVTGLVADALGNIALPFSASNVKVGLPFTCQLQTPYLNSGNPTAQGRRKVIPSVTVRVSGTAQGFQTGTNQPDGAGQNPPQLAPAWAGLAPADTTKPSFNQKGAPTYQSPGGQTVTQLWTGDVKIVGTGSAGWDVRGQVAVEQTLPVALQVTACMPDVLDGDSAELGYSKEQVAGGGDGRRTPRGPGRWQISG